VNSVDADLQLLTEAALAAGQLALTFFRRSPNAWAKAGGSPVTEADMAVDALLRTSLLAKRPHYGWLSEETVDDPVRCERDSIFVVDPIDGTRGFIQGDDRWCVSLARRPTEGRRALRAGARRTLYRAGRAGRLFGRRKARRLLNEGARWRADRGTAWLAEERDPAAGRNGGSVACAFARLPFRLSGGG
jgi:myo-inositol-1(or 4)-monophosphatase